MAGNMDLEYLFRLKWTPGFPVYGTNRRSSNFCIRQDSSWFLRLNYLSDLSYSLFLCNEVRQNLRKSLNVTTHLQKLDDCTRLLIQSKTIQNSGVELWSASRDEISKEISNAFDILELSIICVFLDGSIMSAVFTYEDTALSTQTDIESAGVVSTEIVLNGLKSLSRDWSTFLVDQTFSDIKLKCGNRKFSAHKSVLAARSVVFSTMFRSNIAQRETGMVHVEDLNPDVLQAFLRYIYSGEMPDLSPGMVRSLYEAADKYVVYSLRKTCSQYMVASLTQEDCLDVLLLAEKHSDVDLKEMTSRFVAQHLCLLDAESWSTFNEEHPKLAIQVYNKFLAHAKRKQKKSGKT